MQKFLLDKNLKLAAIILFITNILLIIYLCIQLSYPKYVVEKRYGIVNTVIETPNVTSFTICNDSTIYGFKWHINKGIISQLIYKYTIHNKVFKQKSILGPNDKITFYIQCDSLKNYTIINSDQKWIYTKKGRIQNELFSKKIISIIGLSINEKIIFSPSTNYILTHNGRIVLNILDFLFILWIITILFILILKKTDYYNLKRYQNLNTKHQQTIDKVKIDVLKLEKSLFKYIANQNSKIPLDKLFPILSLAEYYWIYNINPTLAEDIFIRIINEYPKFNEGFISYGEFLFASGRYEEADRIMEQAYLLQPASAQLIAQNYASIRNREKEKYWKSKIDD